MDGVGRILLIAGSLRNGATTTVLLMTAQAVALEGPALVRYRRLGFLVRQAIRRKWRR